MASAQARRLAREIHSNATLNPVPLITGIRPPPLHHSPYNFQILGGVREYISPVPPAATIAAIGWWWSARRFVLNPAISGDKSGWKEWQEKQLRAGVLRGALLFSCSGEFAKRLCDRQLPIWHSVAAGWPRGNGKTPLAFNLDFETRVRQIINSK
jgi:hypothetical protein